MRVFIWWSEAMKQYAQGHIITFAETVEEARANVLSEVEAQWSYMEDHEHMSDEERVECRLAWCNAIRDDISKEPHEKAPNTSLTVFVRGSE